jgi:hypothetical protein
MGTCSFNKSGWCNDSECLKKCKAREKDMQTGKQITTLAHAYEWCIKRKQKVFIRNKGQNSKLQKHSFKVVASMPFSSLIKIIDTGRLFETHQ